MGHSLFPHGLDAPGFIVAWRSKRDFSAGRYPEPVMTYGEAKQRAAALSAEDPARTFWAEPAPEGGGGH